MSLNFSTVKNFLSNSSFLLLFFNTIYYWIKIFFTSKNKYDWFGLVGVTITIVTLTFQLILRWFESGHFPLSNLYESLLFLCWCLLVFYSIIEIKTKLNFFGVIICPATLCLITFADFVLPNQLQESKPLVPALQSNWLFMHVSVMILSYASLLLGCFFGLVYIFFWLSLNFKTSQFVEIENDFSNFSLETNNINFKKSKDIQENKQNFLNLLDYLSYRIIGIGFCFLTLGILSGAVWANETWGSYWNWDPKETWALITWLTFATYLHTRLITGWQGIKPASISVFGLIIIWICYLGVNLLGKGLHSYGFLN